MVDLRLPVCLVAAIVAIVTMQSRIAHAGWWQSGPVDFEDCADLAEKTANKEQKTAALADCSAKFAGRRKPDGGYSYYDFMQDRSFDIAGPNPTPAEQRYIDQQYTLYLSNRRRTLAVAVLTQAQQQEPALVRASFSPVSVNADSDKLPVVAEKTPLPPPRPSQAQIAAYAEEAHARARAAACKKNTDPAKASFSCHWPTLSERLAELKKLFATTLSATAKPGKAKRV